MAFFQQNTRFTNGFYIKVKWTYPPSLLTLIFLHMELDDFPVGKSTF